ncbi:phosphoribosyltransferase [Baekduia sp.]|jgi:predicted phosphoribosyltransferase|uniref:phosphoribosyltransferase n=1 Tax=Baekduia sp. TaxID=2600305 RepID=UPI002E0ACD7E|nr:phosphoribosyltransferase family protein [Baekduia sp.]
MEQRYVDRADAGRRLAPLVAAELDPAGGPPLVLALPRGGVPVGAAVAAALSAPLDVLLVRKLGVPEQPELAFGAIASGGAWVLNEEIVLAAGLDDRRIAQVIDEQERELRRRELRYRGARAAPALADRTIVVVDDGLATGATMRVAVLALRHRGAARVVAVAPVGSGEACALLEADAEAVVCPFVPHPFKAVGAWYEHFDPVADEAVGAILARAWARLVS